MKGVGWEEGGINEAEIVKSIIMGDDTYSGLIILFTFVMIFHSVPIWHATFSSPK